MDQAELTMIENLKKNTGKSLEQWIAIVKKQNLSKHGEMINYLKQEHGFTHGFANLVAHKLRGSDAGSSENKDDLISAQYKGKENLQPIFDKLITEIQKFGKDVELAPKNTYMSVRRKKQFALIQPSTKTRLDIGLNLKGVEPSGKLEAGGSWNAMCTHRIKTETIKDIDREVITWLKKAYDAAG